MKIAVIEVPKGENVRKVEMLVGKVPSKKLAFIRKDRVKDVYKFLLQGDLLPDKYKVSDDVALMSIVDKIEKALSISYEEVSLLIG